MRILIAAMVTACLSGCGQNAGNVSATINDQAAPAMPVSNRVEASGKVEFGEFVIQGLRGPFSGESSHSIPCLCEKLPDYRSLARPETAKRISEMSAREQISLHLAPRAEILPPFPAVKKLDSKIQI